MDTTGYLQMIFYIQVTKENKTFFSTFTVVSRLRKEMKYGFVCLPLNLLKHF